MFRKWIAARIMVLGVVCLSLAQASPAQAQDPTPTVENDANCVACHEHQYYVYDSGKWYCLCKAPMHCIYCHGGRTDSAVQEIAHEGIVLYPTRNHAERCQSCHEEDYMSRVVAFDEAAGISSTPVPVITATQAEPAAAAMVAPTEPPMLRLGQLEPWRLIVLGILLVGIVTLFIFGYRCWRADCLRKIRT